MPSDILAAMQAVTVVAGTTEKTLPENKVFYPALDGMRGFAFLMVFGGHYLELPWGWAGVNLFFVLSGFLITGILFDTKDDLRRAQKFYIRRALRIFPLYYGVFAALFLMTPVFHWIWSYRLLWLGWILYVGNYLRFLHTYAAAGWMNASDAQLYASGSSLAVNMSHFWSLAVEEQFYLIWPWVVFYGRNRRQLVRLCIAVIVLTPALELGLRYASPDYPLWGVVFYKVTVFRIADLLIGALVALIYRGEKREFLLSLAPKMIVGCIIAAAFYYGLLFHKHGEWIQAGSFPAWHYFLPLDVFGASLLLLSLRRGNLVYRSFSMQWLRYIGRISYGCYIFHQMFHPFAYWIVAKHHLSRFTFGHTQLAVAPIALMITLVVASLSYRFYEAPFLNLKAKFA